MTIAPLQLSTVGHISKFGCTLQLLRIISEDPRVNNLRLYHSAFPSTKIEFKKTKTSQRRQVRSLRCRNRDFAAATGSHPVADQACVASGCGSSSGWPIVYFEFFAIIPKAVNNDNDELVAEGVKVI